MKTKEYKLTQIISHAVCITAIICVLVPFALLVISSITDNNWATANGFSLFPEQLSLDAYRYISTQWDVLGRAYLMTFAVTALGTTISLVISTLFAYSLCQEDLKVMRILNFMLIFTMLFNGGLVATYYSYANYFHVRDTIWGLVVPNLLMNAFTIILIKNYYKNSIPYSLLEAAYLDGASELKVYSRIVLPLSKPIVATVGLMAALNYWNDWQNGLYYLSVRNGSHLYTIQIILNNINSNIQMLQKNSAQMQGMAQITMPATTIRMAIAVLGILPILLIYPFFQQYFVKGITLGGVKG